MTPPESTTVAVELAQLRGEINTGFADIKGTLSVLVERTNRTDADLRQLRADMESKLQKIHEDELKPLRDEVEALKRGRWPLRQIGTLVGVGALVVAVLGLVFR